MPYINLSCILFRTYILALKEGECIDGNVMAWHVMLSFYLEHLHQLDSSMSLNDARLYAASRSKTTKAGGRAGRRAGSLLFPGRAWPAWRWPGIDILPMTCQTDGDGGRPVCSRSAST